MLKKLLKTLHEIGAVGVVGSFAACIVLAATAPQHPLVAYAAARQGIAAIAQWLLVPSLAIVLISGLLAIAANKAFIDAGWAWLKALLGISMFEGTLLTVAASARRAAELSAAAAAGRVDPGQMAEVLHTEWGGLWVLLLLSLANVALATAPISQRIDQIELKSYSGARQSATARPPLRAYLSTLVIGS